MSNNYYRRQEYYKNKSLEYYYKNRDERLEYMRNYNHLYYMKTAKQKNNNIIPKPKKEPKKDIKQINMPVVITPNYVKEIIITFD
jgi:hypothetical protein